MVAIKSQVLYHEDLNENFLIFLKFSLVISIYVLPSVSGSLNILTMHLAIPSMLGPFSFMLRKSLTQYGTLTLSTKLLNWNSPLHMFSLFNPTFATGHSPFVLPISSLLADKLMLASHRIKVGTQVIQNLHIHTLHISYIYIQFIGNMCR